MKQTQEINYRFSSFSIDVY